MYKTHYIILSPIVPIQESSHILGVYSSPQRKIEEGLDYLRIGFEEKNEAILLVTDELTKDEVRNEILKKLKDFFKWIGRSRKRWHYQYQKF